MKNEALFCNSMAYLLPQTHQKLIVADSGEVCSHKKSCDFLVWKSGELTTHILYFVGHNGSTQFQPQSVFTKAEIIKIDWLQLVLYIHNISEVNIISPHSENSQ